LRFRDIAVSKGAGSWLVPWNREYDGVFVAFRCGLLQAVADAAAAVAVLTVVRPEE